jgi:LCP family protein required for cell wall assembly
VDDWPREPEDQDRSWDNAQPPPRSGNLPEPPPNQPARNQPGRNQPTRNQPPRNQQPREQQPREQQRQGDLGSRLNPPTGRQPQSRNQPPTGNQPPSGNQSPSGNQPPSGNQRSTDNQRPSRNQPGRGNPPSNQPGRGNPPGTGGRLPRPNADSVRGRIPDDPRDPAPEATRRVPTDQPDRTTRVPTAGGADQSRRDDANTTRVSRSEPAGKAKPERSGPPPRRGMSRGTKIALNSGKVLVALAAVVALAATGVSWAELQKAENGVTTDNVIDPGGSSDNDEKHSDGADDILLVGLDSRTDVQGNALPANVLDSLDAGGDQGEVDTDTMILLHIPDNGGPAMGISIPRDSWVDIPGYQPNKINASYADAKATSAKQLKAKGDTDAADVERQSSQAGAKELITVIQNLTGTHIDHYAEVNLYGFDQISQAVGGVPVCLNHAVHDDKSGANFQAGYFTVEGVQALQFVRQRHNIPGGSTDLQREARQQAFLASMAHKVLSAGTLTSPTELNNLIGAIQQSIIIDSGWNLIDFAGQMAGMSSGSLKFQTIPTVNIDYWPYGHGPGKPNAVQVNPAQVAAFIKGVTGGGSTPPPSNVGSTSNPSSANAPSTGNSATTVDVQNGASAAGSSANGLAAKVLSKLTKAGFAQGATGTIANRSTSTIYFHAGQQDAANAVAAALGGKVTVAQGPSVPSGHVWVYLGTKYSSEGISTAAAVSGPNQSVVPAAYVPAHQADPSSISDSGDTPPCVD